jgi:murein hydrolase activator
LKFQVIIAKLYMNRICFYLPMLLKSCGFLFLFIGLTGLIVPIQKNERIDVLKKQIQQVESILEQSNQEKKEFIKTAQLIQTQIQNRNELVKEMSTELANYTKNLLNLQNSNALQINQLKSYKEAYFKTLRDKWKFKLTNPSQIDLFSTGNLDPSNLKWIWINQLERQKKLQYEVLYQSQKALIEKQNEYASKINEQKLLIENQTKEFTKLDEDLEHQKMLVLEIQKKQAQWISELNVYKKEKAQLDIAVSNAIDLSTKTPSSVNHPIGDQKWRFPLKNGVITSRFGTQRDKINKGILIQNNGIDIQSQNSFVSVVQPAEVIQIRQLPNGSYMVLTRNDNHYLVYSNLDKVLVKQGEWLEPGNNLGECKQVANGSHELHFEIWKGKKVLDPTKFIQ